MFLLMDSHQIGSIFLMVPHKDLFSLLFLIYINDIVKQIGCSIRLFADDASLDCPLQSAQLLNTNLQTISDWDAAAWLVTLIPLNTVNDNLAQAQSCIPPSTLYE